MNNNMNTLVTLPQELIARVYSNFDADPIRSPQANDQQILSLNQVSQSLRNNEFLTRSMQNAQHNEQIRQRKNLCMQEIRQNLQTLIAKTHFKYTLFFTTHLMKDFLMIEALLYGYIKLECAIAKEKECPKEVKNIMRLGVILILLTLKSDRPVWGALKMLGFLLAAAMNIIAMSNQFSYDSLGAMFFSTGMVLASACITRLGRHNLSFQQINRILPHLPFHLL